MLLVTLLCSLIAFSVGFLPMYPGALLSAMLGLLLLTTKEAPLSGLPAAALILGSFALHGTAGGQLNAADFPVAVTAVLVPWALLVFLLGGPARRAAEVRGRFFVDRLSVRAAQLGTGATEDVILMSERLLLEREERWLSGLEGRVRYLQFELLGAGLGAALLVWIRWRASESLPAAAESAVLAGANVVLLLGPRALLVLAEVLGEPGSRVHPAWFAFRIHWRAWSGLRGRWILGPERLLILPSISHEETEEAELSCTGPHRGRSLSVASSRLLDVLNGPRLVEWIAGLPDVRRAALVSLVPAERAAESWSRMLRYLHDEGLPWWDRSRLADAMTGRLDGLIASRVAVEERARLNLSRSRHPGAPRTVVELPVLVEAALSDCDPAAPLPRALESELVSSLRRMEHPAEPVWLVVGARVRPFVRRAMRELPPDRQLVVIARMELARSKRAVASRAHEEVVGAIFDSGPLDAREHDKTIRDG